MVHQRRRHAHRKPIVAQEEPRLCQPPSSLSSTTVSLHPFLFLLPPSFPVRFSRAVPSTLPFSLALTPSFNLPSSLSFLLSPIFSSLSLPHSSYPSIFLLCPYFSSILPPPSLPQSFLFSHFLLLVPSPPPFFFHYPTIPICPFSLVHPHPSPHITLRRPSPTEACSKWQ